MVGDPEIGRQATEVHELSGLELPIEDLDEDGRGIGRAPDGTEVHVAGALPGETVRATLAHRSPHAPRAWADLIAVAGEPAAERGAPARGHGGLRGRAIR